MLKKTIDIIKEETGSTIIIIALAMTVIIASAALVLDLGLAYVTASDIQNVADAVVLSVGNYLPVDAADIQKQAIIKSKAKEYAQKNGFLDLTSEQVHFVDLQNEYYFSMSVEITRTAETNFAKVIGIDHITITKTAKASALPTGSIVGAVPIGVAESTFDEAKESGMVDDIILKFGGGDGTQGFYGFIVLDGAKGNATILENWLKYGYPGVNYVGEALPTASGNKTSAVRNGVNYRYSLCTHYVSQGGCTKDHYVTTCPRIIYTLIYKQKNDTTVEIVGFAPFIIEPSISDDEIRGSYLELMVPTKGQISSKNCGSYTIKLTQ